MAEGGRGSATGKKLLTFILEALSFILRTCVIYSQNN